MREKKKPKQLKKAKAQPVLKNSQQKKAKAQPVSKSGQQKNPQKKGKKG